MYDGTSEQKHLHCIDINHISVANIIILKQLSYLEDVADTHEDDDIEEGDDIERNESNNDGNVNSNIFRYGDGFGK